MTEEIIIDCAFYKDGICASPINKTCEYCKNIDVGKCYHKQLKRLEQENFALTQEGQQKSQTICELAQENKELKEELKSYKHPDVVTLLTNWRTGELDRIHNKIANERDTYRSALEEIKLQSY